MQKSPLAPTTVVLLQPPGTCTEFTRSRSKYPPLGLCHLAATVTAMDAVVLDADAEDWSFEQTVVQVLARQPKAVGMTLTSYTCELVERYAKTFHDRGLLVLAGGPHASLAPLDTFTRCPSVDVVVRGEAEAVFPALVRRISAGQGVADLAGVCTRDAQETAEQVEILRVVDLSRFPPPSFEDLPVAAWWCPDARRRPMVTMLTSRGCPHRCAFCSSPELLGRQVRKHELSQILDHIQHLHDNLGVREISFVDDVFPISPRRTIALCEGIVERGLDVSWFCNARADQITDELADAMAKAGCHQVYLGFESGNQGILDTIEKRATVQQLERGAEILSKHGIARSVGFVIGLPGESDETIADTIALARRVRPERIQFTRFTPLIGSPLGRRMPSHGGFHKALHDQVGAWIAQCYQAVAGSDWGKESW
jgi:anaerobic magnesium-protoporphyrin IX monomethyl ester cyclase